MNTSTEKAQGFVCPYWMAGMLDTPLRRLIHKPEKIMGDLVQNGEIALDLGCGPGYFSVGLARLVGPDGHVIAVDLQPEMLARAKANAERAGLSSRIRFYQSSKDGFSLGTGLQGPIDFALGFWMVHEVKNQEAFLKEVYGLLKPGGRFLVVEPKIHVSESRIAGTFEKTKAAGFESVSRRKVSLSWAEVFQKPGVEEKL